MTDDSWGNWATAKVNEVDDSTWTVSPKEAVKTVLERGGQELAHQGAVTAYQYAAALGAAAASAQELDRQFAAAFPDLMGTDVERIAVQRAIGRVIGDRRFASLMANRREAAFDVVAKLARHELGRDAEPASRGGTGRPLAATSVSAPSERRQVDAMNEVLAHVRGTGRGFGG